MNNYDYPMGADTPNAPWNRIDPEPKKIKVTVSITLSKTVEVEVTDYTAEEDYDEDGYNGINYDYSECDLEQAVRDQVTLPNSVGEFNDWVEDDFAVNLEE
jgi:hypothetical protein